MAYVDKTHRLDAGSMAAVLAVHGAVAAALIFGLSVSGVIEKREIVAGFTVEKPVPPPPTQPPEPETSQAAPRDRQVTIPVPPLPLPTAVPTLDATTEILPPLPPLQPGRGEDPVVRPTPTMTPSSFAPIAAKPRNDPQRWVTTEDYRGNWIRQEMTGRASFRLEIAADGRVAGCTITGSSGHAELDAATCALVTRRARFQPARGGEGEPVAGSYSNAIDWQLPE